MSEMSCVTRRNAHSSTAAPSWWSMAGSSRWKTTLRETTNLQTILSAIFTFPLSSPVLIQSVRTILQDQSGPKLDIMNLGSPSDFYQLLSHQKLDRSQINEVQTRKQIGSSGSQESRINRKLVCFMQGIWMRYRRFRLLVVSGQMG